MRNTERLRKKIRMWGIRLEDEKLKIIEEFNTLLTMGGHGFKYIKFEKGEKKGPFTSSIDSVVLAYKGRPPKRIWTNGLDRYQLIIQISKKIGELI